MKKTLILLTLIFTFFTFSYSQDIKLMSYNIRYDNPKDGENAWPNRKEALVNQILFYEPDVIGTQEGLEHQIKFIDKNLKEYKYVGVARADIKEKGKGEFSAVFYNSYKYEELKSGTFWLSKTPEKPSRGWDASLNRICTYILLQNKESGVEFWVFNTHFDHKGKIAREKSAELIIKKIKRINKKNLPIFLMGDFNLQPDESPIQFITKHLNDSKTKCTQAPYGPVGTYNGFDVCKKPKRRIDYVFMSKNNIIIKKYAVLTAVKDVKYPSDHFPVFINAEIKQAK
ncbi:MAG: endonuclease/exonuclease/phosphatase [Bacteroidetes bacterium]|nr:MAG: endonuclease/exonuclease/phosphatase [Bacteroidota bacterium]